MTTTKDEQISLLPCPFCGGAAVISENYPSEYFVHCSVCDASSKLITACMDDVMGLVAEAWNRRATSQPAQESGERDAKDTARYRYLRRTTKAIRSDDGIERHEVTPESFDGALDAAMQAEAGKVGS